MTAVQKVRRDSRGVNALLMAGVCVIASVLLGACGQTEPPPIKADDVPGTWCSGSGDLLTVKKEGEFVLTKLSHDFFTVLHDDDEFAEGYVLDRDFGGRRPAGGHGRWSYDDAARSPSLDLEFEVLGSSANAKSAEFKVRTVDGEIGLFGYDGDPDQGYTVRFLRCE
ncbi:hypothetical protein ACLQ20_23720 [Micromonospora sp. DT46]|uniref:hypothetical protein n=1 Tax=Micromonospora sp. DT46 TaxID=3393435 RepID=UPI003CE991F1